MLLLSRNPLRSDKWSRRTAPPEIQTALSSFPIMKEARRSGEPRVRSAAVSGGRKEEQDKYLCRTKSVANSQAAAAGRPHSLRQDRFDHFASHIRQAEISPVVEISQLRVIDAHQVQHRCVQIVNTDAIFHGFEADFICFAVARSPFDS